jgi:hypothetical protein
VSILFVYLLEIMVWGVGALFCRALVRRWRAGNVSLLVLGLALSVAEEVRYSADFTGSAAISRRQRRLWPKVGRQSCFLLFMLGYESLWIVVVPVQLTELFFPRHARQPWLRMRGISWRACSFLLEAGSHGTAGPSRHDLDCTQRRTTRP